MFCIKLLRNYHLQGLVLLVFCIKLLGKYHLQGLVLLVFSMQGLALLVFCIKLVGELPLFCLCFASSYWGTTICRVLFACVLHQAIGEVPFAGSYFVFCIKLLGKYHLQGLILLVFRIKLLEDQRSAGFCARPTSQTEPSQAKPSHSNTEPTPAKSSQTEPRQARPPRAKPSQSQAAPKKNKSQS